MSPTVDRSKLIAWLNDKSRDEDETAEHLEQRGNYGGGASIYHRERAKAFRDIAFAVEREEPDTFVKPDLTKRPSGEHRLDMLANRLPKDE